jgi:hypothetical protein
MGCLSRIASDYAHKVIDHAVKYVDGRVHTNGLENFWNLLKRGIAGTYVSVEPFHLFRYLDEQAYRFNNRATKDNPLNNADRFYLTMTQIAGRRLTFAEVTGKVGETPFYLLVGRGAGGSLLRLPRLRSFLSVQLGLDLAVRDGHKTLPSFDSAR